MLYKTITLGLIEENKELFERLRATRTMLATLNELAEELKARHQAWEEIIARKRPDSGSIQIRSDALETAIQELRERLRCDTPLSGEEFSLDAAMAYLYRHTPSA